MEFLKVTQPFCPWIEPTRSEQWRAGLPKFKRPIFERLSDDLHSVPQIIQLTGPRRVGKSTLLGQLIKSLIDEQKVEPRRIIYYDFGDPALLRASVDVHDVVESLFEHMATLGRDGPAYLFLDEIQKLPNWELFLKKYYDLKYPVRVVISGSASSPIFKKSRESLLGRVKDYHVLPFSFAEFLLWRLVDEPQLTHEIRELKSEGRNAVSMLVRGLDHFDVKSVEIHPPSDTLWQRAEQEFATYLLQGGFPEVWTLPSDEKRMEYLYDNQVRKVIEEDLVLAAEFRKPELLKRFYISLLEKPGQEVTRSSMASEIGVNAQQIEKYLPLLELTDLLRSIDKFRKAALKVRQGNQKYYLVDLALRNAVLRIGNELLEDNAMLGLYAENLVCNVLRTWPGLLQIDYYRENNSEVDFVVHTRPNRYLPIEVKYQNQWNDSDIKGLRSFAEKNSCSMPLIITKDRSDFGLIEGTSTTKVFRIPLLHFLLVFDGA